MTEVELERLVVRLMGDSSEYRLMLDNAVQEAEQAADKIQAAATQAEGKSQDATKAASVGLQELGSQITSLGGAITGVGALITGVFGGIATVGLMAAGKFEQTTIAFETMLGSASETTKLLDSLTQFAAETPFEMPQIEAAARGLVQFGERGDELMETLELIGNAAAGTSTDFGMLALIFNQIRGTGRLMRQDFYQLSTRGVLSLKDIANHYKITTAEADKMMSSGKIGFEDIKSIFRELSGEGGRFANLMERQSKSLLGLWSTMKDAISILSREIGAVLAPVAKDLVGWVIALTETIRGLSPHTKELIGWFIGLGAALGISMTAFGGMLILVGQTISAYGSLKLAIKVISESQRAMALLGMAGKLGFAAIAIAAPIAVYKIINSLLGLNQEIERSKKLFDQLQSLRADRSQATLSKIGGMSTEQKQEFVPQELGRARNELDGMLQALKQQEKQLEEIVPTWKSLWQYDRQLANERRREIETTNKAIIQQREFVTDLIQEQGKAGQAPEIKPPYTSEQLEEAKKFTEELRNQVKFFGLTANERKLSEMREQGIKAEIFEQAEGYDRQVQKLERAKALEEERLKVLADLKNDIENLGKSFEGQVGSFGLSGREADLYALAVRGASGADLEASLQKDKLLTQLEGEQKLMEDGRRLIEQYLTPQEKYNRKVDDLRKMLELLGPQFKKTFDQAMREALDELAKAEGDLQVTLKFNSEGNDVVRKDSDEFRRIQAQLERDNAERLKRRNAGNVAAANAAIAGAGGGGGDVGQKQLTFLERIAIAVEAAANQEPIIIEPAGLGAL